MSGSESGLGIAEVRERGRRDPRRCHCRAGPRLRRREAGDRGRREQGRAGRDRELRLRHRPHPAWERTVVSEHPPDPSLDERPLLPVASARGVRPADCALDLALESNLETRFRVAMMNFTEPSARLLTSRSAEVLGIRDRGRLAAGAPLPGRLLRGGRRAALEGTGGSDY